MPSDKPHFKITTIRDRDGDKITSTIDLMDGPEMRMRMNNMVIDLQQEHLEEVLNGLGFYRKNKPEEVN